MATRSSGRPSPKGRSSSTRFAAWSNCPSAGRTSKRGARIGSSAETIEAYFGYAVGPHSWKKYLFPSRLTLFTIEQTANSFAVHPSSEPVPRYAFLGARSCDLHAIEIQDRVFLEGPYVDPHYQARREPAFIIAVNCAQAAATCFCTSMKTGPKAVRGFDLALTELADVFLVEVATDRGRAIMAEVPCREADGADLGARRPRGPRHREPDQAAA